MNFNSRYITLSGLWRTVRSGPSHLGGRGALIKTLLHEWKFFENFSFDQKCEANRSWSGRYWTTSHFRQQNKSKAIKSNLRELQCAGKIHIGWQWCWWHRYVGDFMMVTDFICWWQNHYVGDFFRYVGDFLNDVNRSLTSNAFLKLVTNIFGLQHPSPTSM